MDQAQPVAHRHPDVVHKFRGGGPSAPFFAIDHDEIRGNSSFLHRLGNCEPLPGMTDRKLESGWFIARELAQANDEFQQFDRCRKGLMARWRNTIGPHRNTACLRNLGRHLRTGQHAAVPGLGALREFDLDHLDLGMGCLGSKAVRVELPVARSATKVSAADLPDQIAAMFAVMDRNRALTRVMRETTELGPPVQGLDRISGQRPEAHCGDIEDRRIVGLGPLATDAHPKISGLGHRCWCDRMVDPLEANGIGVVLRAKGTFVENIF